MSWVSLNFLKVLNLFFDSDRFVHYCVFRQSMCVVLCLRVSVVGSSCCGSCLFSLTICRGYLRDLITVLICFAKFPFCLGQLGKMQMLFQRVYFGAPAHKMSSNVQWFYSLSSFALGIEANLSLCLKQEFKVKMFFVTMFSALAQHQIPKQYARTYRAWLPSEIFPKYGNSVEWEKTIVNRFQRATKRGKFSRAAWKFDVLLHNRKCESKNLVRYMTSL